MSINIDVLLAEYNSLRSEAVDNCRGMAHIFLYMVIIIATIFGASISKNQYEATIFLMPLLAPLILVRNSLYRGNVRITHYISTQIAPKLKDLGWSNYIETQPMRSSVFSFDLASYRLLNYYYLTLALIPNFIFIGENYSIGFRILQIINLVIAILVGYATFGCTRSVLVKKLNKQKNEPAVN